MAELAGLVLGAAAILVPAYEGYQKCNAIIAETRKFPRNFRTFKQALLVQKNIFNNECELLLKGVVDDVVLLRMLGDQNHDWWKNPVFQAAFCDHLGTSLEDKIAPFKVIREALDEITKEVLELEQKVNPSPDPTASTRFIPLASASRRLKYLGHKFDWALSKKAKLEGLVETLRKQNRDLFQLRSQRTQAVEIKAGFQNKLQPNKILQRYSPPISEYATVQEVSTKLYEALAGAAACQCHSVNLRLDTEPRSPDTRTAPLRLGDPNAYPHACFNFHFVLTEETVASNQDTMKCRSTCLLIESAPEVLCLSVEDPSDGGEYRRPGPDKHAVRHRKSGGKSGKKVQFDMVPSPMNFGGSSVTGYLGPVTSTPPQKAIEAIEDLCASLKRNRDITVQHSTCLGYVKSDDSYNHIVYKDFPEAPLASRISLSYILSSHDFLKKQTLLPRGDRLKLALVLSLSVLYFGSCTNSWFRERWRSQDIYFFGDGQQQGLLSIGSPHVTTPFSCSGGNELSNPSARNNNSLEVPKAGTTLVRSEQLFSLAIVLIEIAYGDLLCNISESRGQPTGPKRLDEFAEYLKAKTVSDFIGREMGKKYADVVKRCLYCDFGIDESDLCQRSLQEAFSLNVVCRLEQCVKEFLG